jgi:hypothetical protein
MLQHIALPQIGHCRCGVAGEVIWKAVVAQELIDASLALVEVAHEALCEGQFQHG